MLQSAATDIGIELHVVVPKQILLQPNDELKFIPVLSYGLYDDPLFAKTTVDGFEKGLSGRRVIVKRDLDSFLSNRISANDVVVLSTPMAPEIAGFTDWYESLPDVRRPAAVIHFVLPVQFYLAPDLPWQTQPINELYCSSIQRLSDLSRERCLFLCNDRYLAKHFSTVTRNIRVHPIAIRIFRRDTNLALPLRVGLLGAVRFQKGLPLALSAFRQLQGEGAPFNWVFQTSPAELDNRTLEALCASNVEHINHVPTNDQYRELLRCLSILVLPYDPAYYSNYQSSSIFYEAVASGIPVVCSETEFFSRELSDLGCSELIFRPYTAEALAEKIRAVALEYPRYANIFSDAMTQFDPEKDVKLLIDMLAAMSPSHQ